MGLESIFNEILLDHSKYPRNFGVLEGADFSVEGHNFLCGDDVDLHMKMSDGVITHMTFTGKSCAICTASSSIFTENSIGKSPRDIEELRTTFQKILRNETLTESEKNLAGDAVALSGVSKLPSRVKCAALVYETWEVMKGKLPE